MKEGPEEKTPQLADGSRIQIHRGHHVEEHPLTTTIDRFENGCVWVKGSSGSLCEGDAILLEYKIKDDGRYIANGAVEERRPDSTFISHDGQWCRVQDRSFVRISTHGLEVRVPRPDAAPTTEPVGAEPAKEERGRLRFEALDVSAGGIRFESRDTFEIGEECVCHFELPGQSCYVLPARVVRCKPKAGSRYWHEVAVEFVGLDEEHRSEFLRWIYQEQAKRHRNAKPQVD
ncbi:MAG: PilZ domain-containing protein [Myxococcota bacterium]|nr:PilZ domain-containing protein [Myxococcota bacterium]